ncbi:VWA domain-containing protein [Candidatus Bipolaricaulota bacterium]|nr:VWA domain-containing protein [Candidatus Bipolaricaulota bacterium]
MMRLPKSIILWGTCLLLFGAGAVFAQTGGVCPLPTLETPQAVSLAGVGNVAIILDASNSMNAMFDSRTRLDAAKDALVGLFDVLPEGLTVRLSVYGHRVAKADQVASCQDIELLFGPATFNDASASEMVTSLSRIQAQGLTPMAYAIQRAAADLEGLEGKSIIVLLSDGEETCDGDPLAMASMLATMDPAIVLHVIGLDLEPAARDMLTTMTALADGQYVGVNAAGDVLAALFEVLGSQTTQLPAATGIPAQFECYGIANLIIGTEGNDTLIGTSGNDLIYGLGGNDMIIGLEGNDILIGGDGADVMEGCAGDDLLFGEAGDDLVFGGIGNDTVCGGAGHDSLEGEEGEDWLDGGTGCDTLLGGPGRDRLSGDAGDLMLEGEIVQGPCPTCVTCAPGCPSVPVCPVPSEPCATTPIPCVRQPVDCSEPAPVAPPSSCGEKSVDEGACIQLHGTVADGDCNVVEILWSADKGSFDDPRSLDPMYCAPLTSLCEGEDAIISLRATDSCGATGNDSFVLRINNVNHSPTVDAGADVTVEEGGTVMLSGRVYDEDGDAVRVSWSVECGRGTVHTPTALETCFTAGSTPHCQGEDVVLTLTATDACGATARDSVIVHVSNVNHAPIANAGEDLFINEGDVIMLVGEATDADGDPLRFHWSVECGHGLLSDTESLSTCFTAPLTDRCDGEKITVTLTVTDVCGATASDSAAIHVSDVNHAPTVDLGSPISVIECGSVCLESDVRDPDGDPVQYRWTATAGSFDNPTAARPVFHAPSTSICEGEDVCISLSVVDPCGLTGSDTIIVHVSNLNQAPIVHADP